MPNMDADSTVPRSATGADYAELRRKVVAAGLLKRTYAYYLYRGGMCFALLLLTIALLFVLPTTVVWTVPVIVLLGFALVQVALIGHDAGHLEAFKDTRKNWALGQLCWSVVGGVRKLFEVALLSLSMLLWVVLMIFLGWRGIGIFVGSQIIASIYLGAIIAPNHKGMPVWAHGAKLSFLERQVLSSRNVTSRPVWDFLFGGLNYQIEHHLFPTLPRVHFKHARAIIKPFCAAHGLPDEEVDPLTSYRMVYAAFRRVGRAVAWTGWPFCLCYALSIIEGVYNERRKRRISSFSK